MKHEIVNRHHQSVGLSLAVVPLIGLILNYLPWGIRLGPIVVSLSLSAVTIVDIFGEFG